MAQPGSVVSHIKVDDILLGGRSLSDNRIYHVPDEMFNVVGLGETMATIAMSMRLKNESSALI